MENTELKTPVIVYAESTPNPATMKYVANKALLMDQSAEFTDISQTGKNDLAAALFSFPFVKAVYITQNFVTITKHSAIEWPDIMTELREFIKDYLSSEKAVVTVIPTPKSETHEVSASGTILPKGETETKIVEILDEYIKPAVEQDGGEIAFRAFEDGVVHVVLRGACSGCPSSTLTLKAGIEQLLKRMVPGVESVEAINE